MAEYSWGKSRAALPFEVLIAAGVRLNNPCVSGKTQMRACLEYFNLVPLFWNRCCSPGR
jgi:hypothetical protein